MQLWGIQIARVIGKDNSQKPNIRVIRMIDWSVN